MVDGKGDFDVAENRCFCPDDGFVFFRGVVEVKAWVMLGEKLQTFLIGEVSADRCHEETFWGIHDSSN